MYVQIAPHCRVWISDKQLEFVQTHSEHTFRNSDLQPLEMEIAKQLADKAIFVRKKLDTDVQYALNRRIRFVQDGNKKQKELVRQIEAYGLRHKLAELAKREVAKRPFRHLPKQFSKGILIGNIAIVPKKYTGTRYVYVIADMMEAKLLYEDINLKQTAILIAHHLADNEQAPQHILDYDTHFASKLFEIQSAKNMMKQASKEKNDAMEEIYAQRLEDANRLADEYKAKIQDIFHSTFGV